MTKFNRSILTHSLSFALLINALVCQAAPSEVLTQVMRSEHPAIASIASSPSAYEVQIMLTVVSGEGKQREFSTESWGRDDQRYFYPASTVKFPLAVMAAEFSSHHPDLDLTTPYRFEGSEEWQSLGEDIKEIFAVSDDQAFNRLYELFGRDKIHGWLEEKGLMRTRIVHRLGVADSARAERRTIIFKGSNEELRFSGTDSPVIPLKLQGLRKGVAHWLNGERVSEPMDFSSKNFFPLEEQHTLITKLLLSSSRAFELGASEQAALFSAMRMLPREAGYDDAEFYDSYGKFFLFGDNKAPMPAHLQIYNKVGYAFGTLTDNARIVDSKNGLDFVLSATILVNENNEFNDDQYQYDDVGIPFLAELGREVHRVLMGNRADD